MTHPVPRRRARRVRLLLWRSRHVAVAVSAAFAAAQVVHTLAPPPPETLAVVVVDRDLAAGALITADDVRLARLPAAVVPTTASRSTGDVEGRSAAVSLVEGQIVVPSLVGGGELATRGPDGTVVVPVRLQDPAVVAVLSVGDHVDLVTTDTTLGAGPGAAPRTGDEVGSTTSDDAPYVARRATVVATPRSGTQDESFLGSDSSDVSLVLVATLPDDAAAVARASGTGGLVAVVVP